MATALRPASRPTAGAAAPEAVLRQRLARLRRRAVAVPVVRGAAWLVAVVLTVVLTVGLADFLFHLPPLVRAAALAGVLAGGGALIYRLTLAPLAGPRDDLSLALRVEEANPTLNDALASTVQFLAREAAPDGESASMRGEVVRQALRRSEGVDFNRVVDARGLRLAVVLAVASLGAAVAAGVMAPRLAGTAVARLANPFGGVEWPKKTQIELAEVPARVGRNRDLVIQGRVLGVVPEEGTLEVISEGLPVQRRAFAIRDGAFKARLKADEVQKTFQFRVLANDASTRVHEVEVLTLPQLTMLGGQHSPQLELVPPRYTDLPSPRREAPGVGSIDTVTGTMVTLRAAADRPLARAWLECFPEPREPARAAALGAVGHTSPLGVAGALLLAGRLTPRVEAVLSADRRQFTATFRAEVMGAYTISFEDENGLVNSKTYELRVRPDPAPVVRLDRPSPTRDLLHVLPGAELPLQLTVEDTQFAIRSAWLEYRTRPEEAPRRLTLYDHKTGLNRAVAPLAGPGALALPVPRLRLQRLELDRPLSLRSLRHAGGGPLADGDEVQLLACADDFDDVSVSKGPGRSHVVIIRVVSREAFEVILNQEQGRVQQELVRARERQREAIARVKEVEARLRKGEPVAPDRQAAEAEELAQKLQSQALAEEEKADQAATDAERERHRKASEALRAKAKKEEERAAELKRQAAQLSDAELLQQAIRERVGNEREGLRAEVERLRETLRQNGMQSSNAMDRMKQVADTLERMAGAELQQIEPKLAEARKQAELLDEKTRAARQAALKEQAASAKEQAASAQKEAEAAARESKALTDRAEAEAQRAAKSSDALAKQRAEREAQRLRAEAKAKADLAARKRSEADEARKAASEPPTPDKAKRALGEARKHQDEVEKSLSALLRDLEPWSNTREIKGEAGRILQEQKDLQAQREALAERLKDKGPAELKEDEKVDLEALEDAQKRLEERTAQLLDKMKRMAEKQEKTDPQTAREMKETAQEAEKDGVVAQMKSAREAIKGNRLHQAGAKQQEAVRGLQKMVRNLEDRREAELDRLARKMKEQERKIEDLMDQQERLQRKVREAGALPEKQREEELKRLAKEQAKLQEKAKEIAEQLSRLRNERARQAMGRAGEEMGEANQQLSRGRRDDEKQDDVLDRLEEARRELERARKKAEEELGREQIVRVADVIRRIRERQAGHATEAKRIQGSAQEQKRWERGLKASLNRLGDNQAGLGAETRSVVRKELGGAPVFARQLERSARSMEQAAARLKDMVKAPPELGDLPDAETARLQGEALRRLDQLLASLKESLEAPRPLSQSGSGEGGEGGEGGGGPQGDDSLPPPAQVRLLRAMQKEVNDRTETFRKKHPETDKLDARARAELQEIRREQKEVADLLELLLGPGEGPADGGGGAEVERKKDSKAEKEGGE